MTRDRVGARTRVRALVRVVLAMALLGGVLTVVATQPGGADCPVPVSGHWKGTWVSDGEAGTGALDADIVFNDGLIAGRVDLVEDEVGGVTGTESCGSIFLDSTGTTAVMNGTIEADGVTASGTYSIAGDSGTWTATAYLDPDPGVITTIAGRGIFGWAGDGGPATNADFVTIDGVEIDLDGNLVVADSDACALRVVARSSGTFSGQAMTEGNVYRIAGGDSCDSDGDGGPAINAHLNYPRAVAVDPVDGHLLVTDTDGGRVRLIAAANQTRYGQTLVAGNIYTIAGDGTFGSWDDGNGGPATSAGLGEPVAVDVDDAHNVAIADVGNNVVRRVTPDGLIHAFAGNGDEDGDGDGGPATDAGIYHPFSVAYDEDGNLAIGQTGGVRLVAAQDGNSFGQELEAGNIFGIHSCSCHVSGVAFDRQGNLLSTNNDQVDVVAAAEGDFYGLHLSVGASTAIAGSNDAGFSGDGGPAVDARLELPYDVTVDGEGNVIIADTENGRIREVGSVWDPPAPVQIEVMQSVAPTEIGSGAAASWVLSVTNVGAVPATGVVAVLGTGAGATGEQDQFETSTGGGCTVGATTATCAIGTVAPGSTETASGAVVAQGVSAGGSFTVTGGAYTDADPEVVEAAPVVVSVLAPAEIPPGSQSKTASGVAQPGVIFQTSQKAPTAAEPIRVQMKLPKKVAAGSTTGLALGGRTVALVAARPATLFQAALVPAPAVPMTLTTVADEATTFCDGPCSGDIITVSPFSHYNDPKRPAKLTITWHATKKGNGINSKIFKRGDSKQSPRTILPACVKAKKVGYTNLPCVFKKKESKKGDVKFTILLLSGDPKFGRR